MAYDNLLACAEQLGGATRDEAVGGAVEAVLAHVQIGVVMVRQTVAERLRRHGLMERGIKYGDLRNVRQHLLAGFDAHQVGGIVKRTQRDVFLDGGDACIVDQAGSGELFAAVQHAMANRANFRKVGNDAGAGQMRAVRAFFDFQIGAILAYQHVQNHFHGFCVGSGLLQFHFLDLLAVPAIGQIGGGIHGADAFYESLRDHGFIFHVDQLKLQGGGTGVDNQNLHNAILLIVSVYVIVQFV